jgi:EAL domain-containing protein (putative c-di-GMP-specific phosphodiesterase class I)
MTTSPSPAPAALPPPDAELAQALQRAIERRLLHVEYQPEVAADGSLLGFEALVRWYRPGLGLVPLERFLPIAESQGLMQRLGQLVLDTVCRQMARWREAGAVVPRMAVNLGVRELERGELAAWVLAALHRHRLPPESLVIEVTETTVLRQPDAAREQLQALREHGVKVALDDFGTGCSSLSTLVDLPVDALKIDRGFLRGVPGDAKREQVLKAVVRLARELQLRTTAEGVEQVRQLAWLAERGVHAFQGFLFHAAAPADYWTPMLCEDRRHLTGWEPTAAQPLASH